MRAELAKGEASAANWQGLARVGETMQRVAPVFANIVLQERERADQVAVMEAENELNAGTTKLLYDPQSGALAKKGKNAMGAPEEALAGFNQLADGADAKLTNGRQKRIFSNIRSNRQAQLDLTVRRHTMQQIEVYENETLAANVKLGVGAAVANYNVPERRDYEISNVITNVATTMARRGASDEAIEEKVLEVTTAAHVGVVGQYLANNNAAAAQAYFSKQVEAGQISGDEQARVQEVLTRAVKIEQTDRAAQEASDKIIDTVPEKDWSKAVREIKDPEVRKVVESRLDTERSRNDRAERDRQEQTSRDIGRIYLEGGTVSDIPLAVRATMGIERLAQVENIFESRDKTGPTKTDPQAWATLAMMAASNDPAVRKAYLKTDIVGDYMGVLSTEDLKAAVRVQQETRNGDEKAAWSMNTNAAVQTAMVNERLLSMGLDPNPPQPGAKGYDQQQVYRVSEFRTAVRTTVARLEAREGRQATDIEVQQIVDNLSTQVDVTPDTLWFGNNSRPQFAYEKADAQAKDVTAIPTRERQLIEQALRKTGATPTNDAVLSMFNIRLKMIRGDKGAAPLELIEPDIPTHLRPPPQ